MDTHARSGRHALAQLLESRRMTVHVVRLSTAVAVSQLVSQAIVNDVLASDGEPPSFAVESLLHVACAVICVVLYSGRTFRRELQRARDVVVAHEQEFEARNATQQFLREVTDSFEMAEHDTELFDTTSLALQQIATGGAAEILVADASNAHLARVACSVGDGSLSPAHAACGVVTPGACPAVRRGKTMHFDDPQGLAACPRLRERGLPGGCSATCIPVNVLGAPNAVLHTVWAPRPTGTADRSNQVHRLEGVAVRFGSRLGLLRAMARSRVQADTDPLTGLLNRRAFEETMRGITERAVPYSLAMIDLDHFKHLNDTYGHDTGDRALRLFTRALRAALRDEDVIARYGGEEFVVVLPNTDVASCAPAMHRVRQLLHSHLANAELPTFTCSIGLVDSTLGTDLRSLVQVADRALMTAKAQGRDRIVIADDVPTGVVLAGVSP